jgi:hypothetical protein
VIPPRRGRARGRRPGRGRGAAAVSNSNEDNDAKAVQEATRLEQLEQAAKAVFRPHGRAVLVDLLREFIADNAGPEILDRFDDAKTQSGKLQLLWTVDFQPPLTAVEIIQWQSAREHVPPEKPLSELSSEETKALLINRGAPQALADKLLELQITGAQLLELPPADFQALCQDNGAYKRFVRAFIKEEKAPVKVVRSQADLSDEQLESALMAGDVQKAKLLLLAQHNNLEPHQQLLDNLDTQRQVEEVQANLRQGDRIQLLKQRLGLEDERRSSTSKVAFLPLAETDNKSSGGFQTRYPSVLCDVPEGLEPSLRMLDTIERLLRSGQEMSEGRSAGFAHIRTVLRNTSLNLSPLEMGYLHDAWRSSHATPEHQRLH